MGSGTHPEVGQLQSDLDEGVRAGPTLLDQTFPEVTEGDDVRVHILRQLPGHGQGALDDLLALRQSKMAFSKLTCIHTPNCLK